MFWLMIYTSDGDPIEKDLIAVDRSSRDCDSSIYLLGSWLGPNVKTIISLCRLLAISLNDYAMVRDLCYGLCMIRVIVITSHGSL